MEKCCICGRELEIMDSYQFYSMRSLCICDDCFEMKRSLTSENPMERLRAKEYLTILLDEGLVDERICEEIRESVMKADWHLQEQLQEWQDAQAREEEKQKHLADYFEKRKGFAITTGVAFDGYRVKRHIEVVSGEVVIGIGIFRDMSASVSNTLGTANSTFEQKISQAKKEAQKKMIKEAILCGANAVLGVDYDMMALPNQMIVVSANGTAVEVEKAD